MSKASNTCNVVTFSRDAQTNRLNAIAIDTSLHMLRHDLPLRSTLSFVEVPLRGGLKRPDFHPEALRISPDEAWLAIGCGSPSCARLLSIERQLTVHQLNGNTSSYAPVTLLQFSPCSQYLLFANGAVLSLVKLFGETGEVSKVAQLTAAGSGTVLCASWLPDSSGFVVGTAECNLLLVRRTEAESVGMKILAQRKVTQDCDPNAPSSSSTTSTSAAASAASAFSPAPTPMPKTPALVESVIVTSDGRYAIAGVFGGFVKYLLQSASGFFEYMGRSRLLSDYEPSPVRLSAQEAALQAIRRKPLTPAYPVKMDSNNEDEGEGEGESMFVARSTQSGHLSSFSPLFGIEQKRHRIPETEMLECRQIIASHEQKTLVVLRNEKSPLFVDIQSRRMVNLASGIRDYPFVGTIRCVSSSDNFLVDFSSPTQDEDCLTLRFFSRVPLVSSRHAVAVARIDSVDTEAGVVTATLVSGARVSIRK